MAKQLFASAHEAGYWQGQYMVLAYGVTAEDRRWFESRGILIKQYDYIMKDEEWSALECSKKFHKIVMEKYHLFREEFKQWDTIMYMDCDIIVTGPLIRLTRFTSFGSTLDREKFLKKNTSQGLGYETLTRNGYDLNSPMFCTGMFIFSTDIITSNGYNDLLALSKRFVPISFFPDQLVLNLFFYRTWSKLSMAYAFMITLTASVPLCRAKGAIALHFAGHNRPWQLHAPYHQLWEQNLARAEVINFEIPRVVDWRVQSRAYIKETFFIPWWISIRTEFINKYEMKSWYPHLKNIYKFCKSKMESSCQESP